MGACCLRERSNPRRPQQAFSKLYQHFRVRGHPCGLQDTLSTLRPSCSPCLHGSAMDARLATGGWLALTRQGLAPCKRRQAFLGAITPGVTCCRKPQRGTSVGWRQSGARPCSARPRVMYARLRCAPPTYWITSSAWKRSVGGIVSPSALAVLRLMISAYFIGCCTGRSAGLAPLRMRSI